MSGIHQAVISTFISTGPSTIGESYGGGFYAGKISTSGNGTATHYLIVSPLSSGQTLAKWKLVNNDTPNTSSVIDGPTNSSNMNNSDHPAAQFCEGLTIGGYSDWYLPAKNELEVCYYNLKPTTASNDTSSGTNTNAVPSRSSNYTTSDPGQTSATDFRNTGTEYFTASSSNPYWSSTQFSNSNANLQRFDTGYQLNDNKDSSRYVRAVRRIAV